MAGNGFPRVSRHGHRGSQEDHGRNGRKWQKMGCRGKMVENGRKWIFAGKWQKMDFRVLCAIPILLIIEVMVGFRYMHGLIQVNTVNRRTLTEREAMRGMSL